jgi:hypothetical protein
VSNFSRLFPLGIIFGVAVLCGCEDRLVLVGPVVDVVLIPMEHAAAGYAAPVCLFLDGLGGAQVRRDVLLTVTALGSRRR